MNDIAIQKGKQLIKEIKQIGSQGAYEIGKRLREIKENGYIPPNMTLVEFVNSEGIEYKATRIKELIRYVVVVDNLGAAAPERVLRPLAQLSAPADQLEVWERVKNDNPTHDKVKEAVEEYKIESAQPKTKKGNPDKRVFNYTNENIDWAKWSWNPVTGCKHGCEYCYARDIAKRFYGTFEPKEHLHRLSAPRLTCIPKSKENEPGIRNVFVCSMADLFGQWVPQEWIDKVLNAVRDNTQWNYLFLTKNPDRLTTIEWPDHAWVGTTIDVQSRVDRAEEAFKNVNAKVRFISVEPFQEDLKFKHLDRFNWIIIGSRSRSSGAPALQPDPLWVERLVFQAREAGCMVYFKPNLEYRPKEYPIITQGKNLEMV